MTPTLNTESPRRGRGPKKPRPRISFSQIIGEILLTVGILALLFAYYEAYWTNVESGKLQDSAAGKLDDDWAEARENPRKKLTPELGEAFARMYIPTFGSDFNFAVIEGTDEEDLLSGPGRYVDSQLPGEAGNFAVAGHRVGKGAPFNDLGNLKVCDAIVVETFNSWDVYRVLPMSSTSTDRAAEAVNCFHDTQVGRIAEGDYAHVAGRSITTPDRIDVTYPNPGFLETSVSEGTEALLTLTTCHPQFSNAERMIVHAMLVEEIDKTSGERPAVLEES
ncbi:class E sortase [Corynebacterium crudilactis]|uniref:Class E sortase n=1 Tax=Corynebacterium crudilactis TaxID=1652495 RepID=A0A172QWK8_9CORY|nr:class E sortase [Corynebacterium crudilactis]ANE05093.1 class E sortase [Corynebacterium crudilactis]